MKNIKSLTKKLSSSKKFRYGSSALVFTAVFVIFVLLVNVVVSVIDDKTGGLYNVTEKNFKPENVIYATLKGMAQELFDMFDKVDKSSFHLLVASGNAVRLNPIFQTILSNIFNMPLYLPVISEEAAYGTALWINSSTEKKILYKKGAEENVNHRKGGKF